MQSSIVMRSAVCSTTQKQQQKSAVTGKMCSQQMRMGGMKSVGAMKKRGSEVVMKAKASTPEQQVVKPTEGKPEWVALVASADFYFNDIQNETLAEQLRELKRYYEETGREQDFFFACEPAWLDRYPEAKMVKKPAVALVSTDKTWMTFMKLRLDRVVKIDLGNMSIDEATKSTAKVPDFDIASNKWIAPYSPYSKGWWEVFMR